MPDSNQSRDPPFDRPGKYRISVQGFLDERWSERMGGLNISASRQEDHGPVTTLVGQLRDQAELAGVLNTLYELHLVLLSVECLEGK